MIVQIRGKIVERKTNSVVLDVGGIGYEVFVPQETVALATLGEEMALKTAHVLREDAEDLYGFRTDAALQFFLDLLGISGIGPKTALSVLDLATIPELVRAIESNDAALLTRAAGIGRKIAERIIVELRGKASPLRYGFSTIESHGASDVDATDALVELGFPRARAREALREVNADTKDPSSRVKAALKILGKK